MIGSLRSIVIDAPDIASLSKFYGDLAGWQQEYGDDEWITMRTPDGWRIGLQTAPDHVAPQWPSQTQPQQAHLDLRVPDLATGAATAEGFGATTLRTNESWVTMADPAGHPFDLCLAADNPQTTLMGVMIDCPDAKALGSFYSELLGKPITYDGDGAVMIGNDGEQPVLFQQVADYQAPQWPDPKFPQQFHLDLTVDADAVDAAEEQVLKLGATKLGNGDGNFRVYADPVGKPFCLCWD
jgi:predicted enzyme related to lactoylglutathione lyase